MATRSVQLPETYLRANGVEESGRESTSKRAMKPLPPLRVAHFLLVYWQSNNLAGLLGRLPARVVRACLLLFERRAIVDILICVTIGHDAPMCSALPSIEFSATNTHETLFRQSPALQRDHALCYRKLAFKLGGVRYNYWLSHACYL